MLDKKDIKIIHDMGEFFETLVLPYFDQNEQAHKEIIDEMKEIKKDMSDMKKDIGGLLY